MQSLIVYVHGKGGSAEEAAHYRPLFPGSQVVGFDYHAQTPWEAREEFPAFFRRQHQRCGRLILIANSIGAFFALSSLDETLSWPYLCYVRAHPVTWRVPTRILYGEHDALTSLETVSDFAERHHAALTVMPGGEHWFHTEAQMSFLDDWISSPWCLEDEGGERP